MRKQAKFFAPRQHLRRKARGNPKKPNRNRHGLQPVSHGEAAVKHRERDFANLGAAGKFEQAALDGIAGQLLT